MTLLTSIFFIQLSIFRGQKIIKIIYSLVFYLYCMQKEPKDDSQNSSNKEIFVSINFIINCVK